jgi:hypothetical protein
VSKVDIKSMLNTKDPRVKNGWMGDSRVWGTSCYACAVLY